MRAHEQHASHEQPPGQGYCGRFAPSPTGPLHFGSLVTAVGSLLEARRHHGRWMLRIDDIDPPREEPGAADNILRTLERFGFTWDGPVTYQSQRLDYYREALDRLRRAGHVFGCACTRREIAKLSDNGPNGLLYPGTCRDGLPPGRRMRAWRVHCGTARIRFHDRFQGLMDTMLADTIGDFVVRRADGYFAYHLAAAVDDGSSGITHLVRGHDLLWCTPPQRFLQQLLELSIPDCGHLPIVVGHNGQKLSKQNRAEPLDSRRPAAQLWDALAVLRQKPPTDLRGENLGAVWGWALDNWRPEAVHGMKTVSISTGGMLG